MNDVNERKMEQRIHNELRDLPDLKAPKSLGPRVLAAIAARQQAPWWQKSWSDWPFSMKAVFLIMGISILGGLVMASTAIPQTSTFTTGISEWLATQLSSLKPYYDVAARLAESLGGRSNTRGPISFGIS